MDTLFTIIQALYSAFVWLSIVTFVVAFLGAFAVLCIAIWRLASED